MKAFIHKLSEILDKISSVICATILAGLCLIIVYSVILCVLLGDPNQHALLGSVASLTNVGPSLGSIGSLGNFNAEPNALKVIFTVDMFLGRVEIYPVFAVVASIFHRR